MKIAFIVTYENLGVQYLISYLKKHSSHEISIVYAPFFFEDGFLDIKFLASLLNMDDLILERIEELHPDLIAFSTMSVDYRVHSRIAIKIKSKFPNIKIIMGGVHPSLVPETVIKNDSIDYLCVGEGEISLLELCNNFYKIPPDIKNIWMKIDDKIIKNEVREPIHELDSLPFPEKALFYKEIPYLGTKYVDYLIMSSRGCPFSCTYCYAEYYNKNLYRKKKFYRRRSVSNVIEEIEEGMISKKIRYISFLDDVFTANIKWLKEFSEEYIKRKLNKMVKITVLSRAEFITDETVNILKSLNCKKVDIGVQNGNYEIRKNILNRGNIDSNNKIIECCQLLKKYNINAHIDHIHDIPYTTENHLMESAELYNKCKPAFIAQHGLVYFPKSSIISQGLKDKRISEEDVKSIENGHVESIYKKSEVEMTRQYRFLFFLIPFLKEKTIEKIIKKEIYKWKILNLLYYLFHRYLALAAQLITSISSDGDFRIFRYFLMYFNFQSVTLILKKMKRVLLFQ